MLRGRHCYAAFLVLNEIKRTVAKKPGGRVCPSSDNNLRACKSQGLVRQKVLQPNLKTSQGTRNRYGGDVDDNWGVIVSGGCEEIQDLRINTSNAQFIKTV